MMCDKCDKPAVVHEVTIKNGQKREVHLCSEHAAEEGFVVHQPSVPINELLKQFVISQSSGSGKATAKRTCSECGMTFAEFRKTGTLGCPTCYEAFEDQLGPLIERAQNSATHHIGKTPIGSSGSFDRQLEIRRLTRELDQAIASEEYERAAELRDRLNAIEPIPDDGGAEAT